MATSKSSTPRTSCTSLPDDISRQDLPEDECFIRHNWNAVRARLSLIKDHLRIEAEDACMSDIRYNVSLPLNQIIGSEIIIDSKENDEKNVLDDDSNAILCPVLTQKRLQHRRQRSTYSRDKFRFNNNDYSEDNSNKGIGDMQHWRLVLHQRERVRNKRIIGDRGDSNEDQSIFYRTLLKTCHLYVDPSKDWPSKLSALKSKQSLSSNWSPSKPLLLLINPKSGKGNALKLFEKMVRPLLNLAHIKFDTIVTTKANHACHLLKDLDLDKYSALVIVSGDGLLFEVFEGLSSRADWSHSHLKPVAIIPSGSGNGLSRSLINERKDLYNEHQALICSTMALIRGKVRCMDMMRVETLSGKVYHAFLSIAWGFMSDCDIGSERLRFLGELRFTLWGIYRLIAFPGYRVKLAYCPLSEDGKMSTKKEGFLPKFDQDVPENWVKVEDELAEFYVVSTSFISGKINLAPEARTDDGLMWMTIVERNRVGRRAFLKFLADTEKGTHGELDGVDLVPITAFRLEPLNTDVGHMTIDGEEIESQAIQACILPSFARIIA